MTQYLNLDMNHRETQEQRHIVTYWQQILWNKYKLVIEIREETDEQTDTQKYRNNGWG